MAAYADIPTVKAMLNITDTAADDRLDALNVSLSALLDDAIGRGFGAAAVAETREVTLTTASPRLITTAGIHTISAIETGGTWDGAAWVDGEAVAAADYRLTLLDHDGLYWGIDALAGNWSGTVRVTATWGDQSEALVPPAVVEAANVLVATAYKRDEAGANGDVIGPDGFPVVPRDGWSDARVKRAIERHRAVRLVV
jgi:hypothetical protein